MELPIIPDESVQRERLRRKLSLNNRPSLKVGSDRLKALSLSLSSSSEERTRFVSNPVTYLDEHDIQVEDVTLIPNGQPTSESAVTVAVLAVFVAVTVIAAVNAGVTVNVATSVNVSAVAAVAVSVFAAVVVKLVCDGSSFDFAPNPLGQFGSTVV